MIEAQVKAVKRALSSLVIIPGNASWDMDYVARRVLAAAEAAKDTK